MIIQARQARTANACAPVTQRSTFAAGQIRWYYGPSLVLWVDALRDQQIVGGSVADIDDYSGKSTSVTQITASKQPVKAVSSNVACFQFDGVNDCLNVSAIDLSSTKGITLIHVARATASTYRSIYEMTADWSASTVGFQSGPFPYDTNNRVGFATQGNVGFAWRHFNITTDAWQSIGFTIDRTLAAASQLQAYANGNQITSFTDSSNSANTNFFGNQTSFVGSRNNGASQALNGRIAQLILLRVALSVAQSKELSTYLRQAAGVA